MPALRPVGHMGVEAVESVLEAFDRALARASGDPPRRHMRLVARTAAVSSADTALLAAFFRPFRHLEVGPEEIAGGTPPDLEVLLVPGALADGLEAFGPEPALRQPQLFHGEGGRFVAYRRDSTVAGLDRRRGRMVVWCGPGFPTADRGQPLFALFAVWLHDLGLQLVHAGLVASGESGALLGGAGGSGKSTTALACMRAGLAYLGDDSIALSLAEPAGTEPWGHSLYASARLEASNLERFPELAGVAEPVDPREPDKLVLYPLDRLSDAEVRRATAGSARLVAVLLPRVTGGPVRAVPLPPAKALLLLAPSSIRAMAPQPMAAGLDRLARLVETVPCYRLEVAEDLGAVAREVSRILSAAAR